MASSNCQNLSSNVQPLQHVCYLLCHVFFCSVSVFKLSAGQSMTLARVLRCQLHALSCAGILYCDCYKRSCTRQQLPSATHPLVPSFYGVCFTAFHASFRRLSTATSGITLSQNFRNPLRSTVAKGSMSSSSSLEVHMYTGAGIFPAKIHK